MAFARRTPDGSDAAAYAWMSRLDRTGWAWEWLRRDPHYDGVPIASVAREARGVVLAPSRSDPMRGLLFRRGPRATGD